MTKPFKFRYVREITGSFLLLIIVCMVGGIVLAGRAQGWFEEKLELHLRFPEEGLAGIQKGAKVETLGTQIGVVHAVVVNEDDSMEAILRIKGPFIRFIRSDSRALIKKTYGVAGDAYIEITRGHAEPLSGNYLAAPAQKDRELTELIQELVEQIQWAAIPMMEQVTTAVEQYADLAIDLQHGTRELQSLLKNLDGIAAGLQKGEGTAGGLLKDTQTLDSLNDTVASVQELIREAAAMVRNLQAASTNIPAIVDESQAVVHNIRRASGGISGMMRQTEDTLLDAEILLEGIRKHWLLKKYMPADPPAVPDRIPPGDVTAPQGNESSAIDNATGNDKGTP